MRAVSGGDGCVLRVRGGRGEGGNTPRGSWGNETWGVMDERGEGKYG